MLGEHKAVTRQKRRETDRSDRAILVPVLVRLAVVELDELQAVPAPHWGRKRLQLGWRQAAWRRGLKGHILNGVALERGCMGVLRGPGHRAEASAMAGRCEQRVVAERDLGVLEDKESENESKGV